MLNKFHIIFTIIAIFSMKSLLFANPIDTVFVQLPNYVKPSKLVKVEGTVKDPHLYKYAYLKFWTKELESDSWGKPHLEKPRSLLKGNKFIIKMPILNRELNISYQVFFVDQKEKAHKAHNGSFHLTLLNPDKGQPWRISNLSVEDKFDEKNSYFTIEKFKDTLYQRGERVAIKTSFGSYLHADPDGTIRHKTYTSGWGIKEPCKRIERKTALGYQKFWLISFPDGRKAIKTWHGTYLHADPDGSLRHKKYFSDGREITDDNCMGRQKFRFTYHSNNRVTIRSNFNKYITAIDLFGYIAIPLPDGNHISVKLGVHKHEFPWQYLNIPATFLYNNLKSPDDYSHPWICTFGENQLHALQAKLERELQLKREVKPWHTKKSYRYKRVNFPTMVTTVKVCWLPYNNKNKDGEYDKWSKHNRKYLYRGNEKKEWYFDTYPRPQH